MNGIQKFLSKREGRSKSRSTSPLKWRRMLDSGNNPAPKLLPSPHLTLFSSDKSSYDNSTKVEEEDDKIKEIQRRLSNIGVTTLGKPQIRYALRSKIACGRVNEAYELLILLDDSLHGILRFYNPSIKLLGAENRNGVTCYLDALLFAMFARLDCFEAILYNSFDDEPRQNLSVLLRLWVNLLRSGKLITTDFTKQIQDALAKCGWHAAAGGQQQDVSEAFTFITEKLNLPLLTLKMDIFHTGREEAGDDHKFINERLLEVAIPSETVDGKPITLEACLENYFNNRIDVKRYLERRNTGMSVSSMDSVAKESFIHVETTDLGTSSQTASPISASSFFSKTTQITNYPSPLPETTHPMNPNSRMRSTSIVMERFIPENKLKENEGKTNGVTPNNARKGSLRKEVMMPAWQIFSLIPWYTDSTLSDAQSAIHFSSRRPILGICLKRYSVLPNGNAVRLNTFVDIPIEIGLPHFIQDDEMENEGPLCGNFKLSLQAVICHRGNSVESGHYIALVRGTSLNDPDKSSKYCRHWMRFDDLTQERITLVDIEKALVEESPYLLFYQILPIDDDSETVSRGRLSSSNDEEAQSRKLFHNPYPDVTVNDSSDVETDGVLHDHYPNHRFESPGASSPNSQIRFPAEANDEFVGDRVKSTLSSEGTSTSANAVRSISREMPDVVDDGHMIHASTKNDTIVVVEPTSDVDFEGSNTRSSRVERRAQAKHAMLAKEKPDNPVKHRSHHSLKKRSGKPDRECLVM
ncbi:ubiquitin C-terminal hydrolase [Histoplasma capsulatum G186AR]|uniref:ubiquitinyl hydrolase 1 n=1 Tax=Ajellomyces capsulatus TaxID=5037 RepID=A0A8H8CXJ1_AJECA|nr:ubiquitin C-terminal hydrolase [Histoplasma capsulatum]QSS74853.1 ubiquitin C-terminal hydrolase [Histoplasma capsulatum G186AR]